MHRLEEPTEAGTRHYTVVVPAEIPAGGAPLVLSLHYAGEVSPWYGAALVEQLVEPAPRRLNPVIVAPDCPGRGWADPVSQAWVVELLDAVEARLPLDPQRHALVDQLRLMQAVPRLEARWSEGEPPAPAAAAP